MDKFSNRFYLQMIKAFKKLKKNTIKNRVHVFCYFALL